MSKKIIDTKICICSGCGRQFWTATIGTDHLCRTCLREMLNIVIRKEEWKF